MNLNLDPPVIDSTSHLQPSGHVTAEELDVRRRLFYPPSLATGAGKGLSRWSAGAARHGEEGCSGGGSSEPMPRRP
jgi:hypothetical protein